jgi:uncharacterized protein YjiS (DUF1127 family)
MTSLMSKVARSTSPVERLDEPDRWTPPFEASPMDLNARGGELRTEALVRHGSAIANALGAIWRKAVLGPVSRWLERERAIRELSALNEHELHDLGVAPGMIPYLVSGKARLDDGGPSVANENVPKRVA